LITLPDRGLVAGRGGREVARLRVGGVDAPLFLAPQAGGREHRSGALVHDAVAVGHAVGVEGPGRHGGAAGADAEPVGALVQVFVAVQDQVESVNGIAGDTITKRTRGSTRGTSTYHWRP
jgi:hypothetical protein